MKIAVSGESTMDLKPHIALLMGIHILPFHVQMGEESYADGADEASPEKIFEYFERTGDLAKTSAANAEEYRAHFDKLLEEYDAVIHFSISSRLSGGYSNACLAAEGDKRIRIVDSKTVSFGIAMMAREAKKLIDEGVEDLDEIEKKCLYVREHTQASLLIDKLDYMWRGGRCSKLTLIGANLLKIKPAIVSEEDGKLGVGRKFRGKLERSVQDYLNATLDSYTGIDYSYAMLGYTVTPKEVIDDAVNLLKERGFKEVFVSQCNATDSCHGGPNVVGFAFLYEKKKSFSLPLPFKKGE